ncbi:MerR family transcriptional regulator [Miltoncostaea marina]|uniref:MerR family transcriptional regulator n=1 Tax=Miltoncostaea marina TaxID=2843215 RepID=UPI001C3DBBD4|nr:helix-turn-helix domain-containing protein [Miltoncostaea marina]
MIDDEDEPGWPRVRSPRGEVGRGPRTLTASEAAALLGVSVATIRGWADQGRVPSHRTVGGHRRFEVDELRDWLARRGAPPPEPRRLRRAPQELPPCPLLARALNARTEAIVDRVLAGYDERIVTPLPAPSGPAARRVAVRFVRVVAAALEDGRPGAPTGRVELAGLRGGLEGPMGARVIAEHTRVAAAVIAEAEAARAAGVPMEPLAIPALHAVIDHARAAVVRGFEQAVAAREPSPRAPAPR